MQSYEIKFIPPLMEFLNAHRKQPGQPCTHTSLRGGSFHIPDHHLKDFHLSYHSLCANTSQFPALTEMKKEYSPVMIDLDLKFDKKFTTRLVTKQHLTDIIALFSEHLEDPNYILMQRDDPYLKKDDKNPIVKDGIHLAFPDTVMNIEQQLQLREDMMPELENILSDLPLLNSIEDIYDRSVPAGSAPWLLYFSAKPKMRPYRVTKAYKSFKDDGVGLIDRLSIRMNGYNSGGHDNNFCINPVEEYLSEIEENKKSKKGRKKKDEMKIVEVGKSTNREIPLDSEEGVNICNLISQVRHNFPQHNLNVTRIKHCGKHIFIGTTDHFCPFIDRDHKRKSASMYIDLSEQGICLRCYDSDCHDQKWPTKHVPIPKDSPVFNMFKDNNIVIHNYNKDSDDEGELLDFQEDNLQIFDDAELNECLLESLNGTHYDIAKLIFLLNKEKYKCTGLSTKMWYEFKDHRWKKGIGFINYISEHLVKYYKQVLKFYKKKKKEEDYRKKYKDINDLIRKLKTTTFKNNIISECCGLFYDYDSTFVSRVNSNTRLLGFEDGVYDLESGEFRDGEPNDWLTFSVGYTFPTRSQWRNELREVKKFLKQVFPIKDVRRYILKVMASCLHGEINEELFHIFTGSGANGKSKFVDLNAFVFGEYGFRLSIALLTQKRTASNNANPDLADKMGKRLGIFQEPDKGDEIKVGIMKEYTGGDMISVRQLYGQQFEFKPQFNLFLCCNDLPKIPSTDGGTWRRMRVVEFVSKFVDHPNPENSYEFPIDRHLKDKIKEWGPAYMLLLFKYYKIYQEEGIEPPEEVVKFTKQYQEESDELQAYFSMIIKDSESFITITSIYNHYKNWCLSNNLKPIKRLDFKREVIKNYGNEVRKPPKGDRGWFITIISS